MRRLVLADHLSMALIAYLRHPSHWQNTCLCKSASYSVQSVIHCCHAYGRYSSHCHATERLDRCGVRALGKTHVMNLLVWLPITVGMPVEVDQAASRPHDAGQPRAVGAPVQERFHDRVALKVAVVLGVRCRAGQHLIACWQFSHGVHEQQRCIHLGQSGAHQAQLPLTWRPSQNLLSRTQGVEWPGERTSLPAYLRC